MPFDETPAREAAAPWPELDRGLLHATRPPPPAFPLDVLSGAWRSWVDDGARSFSMPDYVAQALLGAVSAVCAARVSVDVAAHWREPLVLWQAMVGGPSAGKTPALRA